MRLLSIIKVIVVMIDARSEWNVKDGQTKFYEYYLKMSEPEYQDAAQHFIKRKFSKDKLMEILMIILLINLLKRLKFILKQIN